MFAYQYIPNKNGIIVISSKSFINPLAKKKSSFEDLK